MGMLGKLSIKGHKEGVDIVRVVVGHGVKHPNTAERHIVWMELYGVKRDNDQGGDKYGS